MNFNYFFQIVWMISLVGLLIWSYIKNIKSILYSGIILFILWLLTINFGGVKCYKKTYGWNQLCMGVLAMIYSFILFCITIGYFISRQ